MRILYSRTVAARLLTVAISWLVPFGASGQPPPGFDIYLFPLGLHGDSVALDIGRALHRVPGRASISFVHRRGPTDWWITELDPNSGTLTPLAPTLEGIEDLAWTPGPSRLRLREPHRRQPRGRVARGRGHGSPRRLNAIWLE